MTLSGTVTQTALRTDFDALTTSLSGNTLLGQEDFPLTLRVASLAVAMDVSLRSVDFTAPDDLELRVLRVLVTHTAAVGDVTATLTVTDGDTAYLLDQTISVSVASLNGTAQASLDCRTTTQAKRLRLLRGVRYRLTLSTAATVDVGQATLLLRTRRRTR
jgi:hypothetical protein